MTDGIEEDLQLITNSILSSVKKAVGISPEDKGFDTDIIICINSAFGILTQLGVGPLEGFEITSEEETWDQFIGDNKRLNMVKSYITIKVKLMFDPPTVAAVLSSYQELAKEYEGRLNYEVDPKETFNSK